MTTLFVHATVGCMKTVSIRELHNRTGEIVREAVQVGEILVTDNGRTIAKIIPESEPEVPYYSKHKPSAAFLKFDKSGKSGKGPDATIGISEDRKDRI